jgi:metal-responsive CopG/Arc/MetJ family transcriptional regulator
MDEEKSKRKYVTLKLPDEFVDMVKKFIKEHPEWGYTSVPEFVKEAIRDYILYLESLKESESSKKPPSQ